MTIGQVSWSLASYKLVINFQFTFIHQLFFLVSRPHSRFYHPAIISALAKLFFRRSGYGYKKGSNGLSMVEGILAAAMAWVCPPIENG
jgi:hypothetical protein